MLEELSKTEERPNSVHIEKVKNKIKVIESFSSSKSRYLLLFDFTRFAPIYISENIKFQNYTSESFCKLQLADGLRLIYPYQINLGLRFLKWKDKFYTQLRTKANNNDRFIIGGIKFRTKQNKFKTFVIKGRFLAKKNGAIPCLCFLEVEEVTRLWKGDTYWIQYIIERDEQLQHKIYYSDGKKKEAQYLLSSKELKIIQLIAQNKASIEIAELLALNVETIKKHRKNMIAKTQTKDITSLIQLLSICDMI